MCKLQPIITRPYFKSETGEEFREGDRVRVILHSERYSHPYGNQYCGEILEITETDFVVKATFDREIPYDKVSFIKKIPNTENFNTIPYFDDTEREFWRTHFSDGTEKDDTQIAELDAISELEGKKMPRYKAFADVLVTDDGMVCFAEFEAENDEVAYGKGMKLLMNRQYLDSGSLEMQRYSEEHSAWMSEDMMYLDIKRGDIISNSEKNYRCRNEYGIQFVKGKGFVPYDLYCHTFIEQFVWAIDGKFVQLTDNTTEEEDGDEY